MEFRCRLGTPGGGVVEQVFVAESEAHLRRELDEKGVLVLSLRPAGLWAGSLQGLGRRRRVSPREFLEFNQELATLIRAGMPLVQSLDLLRSGMSDPTFRPVLDSVHDRVKAGAQLSESFAEHGDLFPRIYTASLMAGERSGNLETVIRRYVAYARLIGAARRRAMSALIYPLVLVLLAVVVVAIIVLRLVPAFSDFYASFDAELPLLTRIIVQGSVFVGDYLLVILLGIGAAAVLGMTWFRRPGNRQQVDRVVLRLPWVGDLVRKFSTSQMARTLATLLGGGIPLVQALDVTAGSVSNRHVARELDTMGQSVREGHSLAGTMRARAVFPEVAVKMTEVGESTGALQDMLNSLADFYDEELETSLNRFVTLVEPALLIILGIVIAALLLALYMPLFQLSSVVR